MIGSRESRLVQYHAGELVSLGWDTKLALEAAISIVYDGSEPEKPDGAVKRKWGYYRAKFDAARERRNDKPKRIAIPKTSLSEANVRSLGFTPSAQHKIDSGLAVATWRHSEHNYCLQAHPDLWVLYQDTHPSLSRALAHVGGPDAKATAIKDAIAHVFGKGAPGLGKYLKDSTSDRRRLAELEKEAKST